MLDERARPAVREDQRDPTAAFVDKVDPHSVDLAAEVRELVQPPLLQAPVEPVSPVFQQPAHIGELGALLPPRLGRRRRPARGADPLAQVGQRPLGNLNLEALDVKRRHTAQILSLAALAVRRPTTAVRPATMHDRARAYARVSARLMRAPIVSRTSRWGRLELKREISSAGGLPSSASLSAGSFLRSWPRARLASTSGSLVPATSASSIARPDLPMMSVATQPSLLPVSSIALCNRSVSRSRRAAFRRGRGWPLAGLERPRRDVSLRPAGAEWAYCSPCLASRLRP